MHFRRTGTMPDVMDPSLDAQTKAAFSSNPAHDFEEEDEFRSGRVGEEGPSSYGNDRDEDYALLQHNEADDLGHSHQGGMPVAYDPTAPAPGSVMHDYDTSYHGSYGQRYD
jgi:translocation protein SEC72